jgi:3-deoxy-manno-octulosonate cytidylyltransferase (CMP-KDO synthetase)
VGHHGNNPDKNVIAVIPARYASVRLPGKLLMDIAGKPLILHTLDRAKSIANIDRVIVATDDQRIADVVGESGCEVVLTSEGHASGSDRVAEVAEGLPSGSIIVNVQGDEPLISPRTIEAAVEALLLDDGAQVSTTCEPITDLRDVLSPDVVKVVTDESGVALYFSRSPIPFPREAVSEFGSLEAALVVRPELLSLFRKHTGLYVYRREFLLSFTALNPTILERAEMLEQLRILESGGRIKVVEVSEMSIGVDTAEDLAKVNEMLKAGATVASN